LYILALAGKSQVSAMNYYKQNTNLLATDSRYLLSAAFALAGDKAAFKQLLPISFGSEVPDKQTGGSFNSPIRDEAIALNALLEVDKNNPQTMVMV
jgi:alpha-2-macroglobulin